MSSALYNSIWKQAQKDLEFLIINDYENQGKDCQLNKTRAQNDTFELYIKYIMISNQLEEVYDKMVNPQKRLLARKLLDCCLGRVIELKQDLVNIDMMEFNYNNTIMEKLKLTPFDTTINIPTYFRRDRETEIEQRKSFIDDILIKLGFTDKPLPTAKLTELEAIKLIQTHERARQGRLRANLMREIRMLKDKGKYETEKEREQSDLMAAIRIQKLWRGYTARQKSRRRKIEEMVLIGMLPPSSLNQQKAEIFEAVENTTKERYKAQKELKENYERTMKIVEQEIKTKHGLLITNKISDEIREWIRTHYNKTGKLPDFPSKDHGGSRHLSSRTAADSEVSQSSAMSSKESRKSRSKSKTSTKSNDSNKDDNPEIGFKPLQSNFLPDIKSGIEEFLNIWCDKPDPTVMLDKYDEEIIYAEKYSKVESELRTTIDDLMRQELDYLQAALDRDRAAKGKKVKKQTKKTRRSGKKSKKKKEKDLTPDRTLESLFEEFVINGIIKQYSEIPLKKYIGDKSYTERNGLNPTSGDVKEILKEYCILPLGSETIKCFGPCIKSLLLAGPKGSGKKTLVKSICTETGAILFDITSTNIVGKYPGKTGLIMLMHLLLKISRLLQPSVIFMENVEKTFMKKIPKTDKSDPKRLKKDLPKLIKNILQEDRVIFIGTSNSPWEADQKLLQQVFNRYIYIPRPDYGGLSCAWKTLIDEYTGGLHQFDYSLMAKISDGYTIGAIFAAIKEVLSLKRKWQLSTQPLTHVEFINSLSTKDPVYFEEEEAFKIWYTKTPLGRKKQAAIDMEIENKRKKDSKPEKTKKKR